MPASESASSVRTAPASRRCCSTWPGCCPSGAATCTCTSRAGTRIATGSSARSRLRGTTVSPATIGRIRDLVGIVFQDPDDQLIGLTVGEDVGYGPRARRWPQAAIDRAVRTALHSVNLEGYEHRSPHHLSTGEKRRVCLAGVLACAPGLLLLDEPSSGLDPRGRRSLAALLRDLAATIIVASHDLVFIEQVCSRIVVLDGGVVVADGAVGRDSGRRRTARGHGLA